MEISRRPEPMTEMLHRLPGNLLDPAKNPVRLVFGFPWGRSPGRVLLPRRPTGRTSTLEEQTP